MAESIYWLERLVDCRLPGYIPLAQRLAELAERQKLTREQDQDRDHGGPEGT